MGNLEKSLSSFLLGGIAPDYVFIRDELNYSRLPFSGALPEELPLSDNIFGIKSNPFVYPEIVRLDAASNLTSIFLQNTPSQSHTRRYFTDITNTDKEYSIFLYDFIVFGFEKKENFYDWLLYKDREFHYSIRDFSKTKELSVPKLEEIHKVALSAPKGGFGEINRILSSINKVIYPRSRTSIPSF